ncbi:MAG: hypothetical protein IJ479_09660 [Alphaproteobacteria bacterium]|nr:hypothetical protein [Alphaproteobacteria bacterium]
MKKPKPENKKRKTTAKENEWRRVSWKERGRRKNGAEKERRENGEIRERKEREAGKRKWQGMWKEKRTFEKIKN